MCVVPPMGRSGNKGQILCPAYTDDDKVINQTANTGNQ